MSLLVERFLEKAERGPASAGVRLLNVARNRRREVEEIQPHAGDEKFAYGFVRLQSRVIPPTAEQLVEISAFLGISQPESQEEKAHGQRTVFNQRHVILPRLQAVRSNPELAARIGRPSDAMFMLLARVVATTDLGTLSAYGSLSPRRDEALVSGILGLYHGIQTLRQQAPKVTAATMR